MTDRELLARVTADRDEQAIGSLVRRHGPMVLGVCLRVLNHREDAEDAFQSTFLALIRTAESFRPRESVGGWLHRVAYRVAQKARIAGARRRKYESSVTERPLAGPVDELTVREAHKVLDEELARLPDKFRVPLVLCYLEGLTRDEAAGRLGWSESTLKSRLEQARDRLGARLSARGFTLPAVLVASLLSGAAVSAAVPSALLDSVVGAALAPTTTAPIPEGASTLSLTKLKIVTAALIGVAVLGTWAGVSLSAASPQAPEKTGAGAATAKTTPEKPAARVDLAKIERAIKKEPVYKTKTPKYGLLVLGPKAETRVWLVHDGDVLYVDRNGNGDLTEDGERIEATDDIVYLEGAAGNQENRRPDQDPANTLGLKVQFKVGTITERDGKTKHALWVGSPQQDGDGYRIAAEVAGKYLQMTDGWSHFANRPKDAPIVHLNGPLAIHRFPPWGEKHAPLIRGDQSNQLMICIGTEGLGKFTQAWLNPFKDIPEDVHPTADIEFPNKKAGGKPIQVRLALTKRGGGNHLFYAPLSIPDEAADGKAKVTVNFADWKGGGVPPTTFDLVVETSK